MIFTITSGEYSDYAILGYVEGEGDIQALFNEFLRYLIPDLIAMAQEPEFPAVKISAQLSSRIYELGLVSEPIKHWLMESNLAEAFVTWLTRDHGFKRIENVTELCVTFHRNNWSYVEK